jgi:hypothetical protein
MRGYFPHHHGFVGAPQGFVAAPMVATILAPGSFQFGSSAPPPSSATMDLAHALERQTAEISAARAHRLAIQAAEDAALLRVRQQVANMSVGPADVKASTSDAAQLAKAIEDLSNRVTAMEKLLIIHDDLIRKKLQPEKKTP